MTASFHPADEPIMSFALSWNLNSKLCARTGVLSLSSKTSVCSSRRRAGKRRPGQRSLLRPHPSSLCLAYSPPLECSEPWALAGLLLFLFDPFSDPVVVERCDFQAARPLLACLPLRVPKTIPRSRVQIFQRRGPALEHLRYGLRWVLLASAPALPDSWRLPTPTLPPGRVGVSL